MRPAPALLLLLGLGLGLGLRCGCLPPPPAPRGAPTQAPAPGAPAGDESRARPRPPAPGEAAPLRSAPRTPGLCLLRGLSLRPRVAPRGGGSLSGSDRGLCFRRGPARRWPWRCLHVRVLLRALRARRAAPTPMDPRSPQWLGPLERTFHPGLLSPTDASPASRVSPRSSGLHPFMGFVAQTKCPTHVNSSSSQAGESSASCQASGQVDCSISRVHINRTPGHPMVVYTRRMSIDLNATADYDCPNAQDTYFIWKVYPVASLFHEPDWKKPLVVPDLQLGQDPTFVHIPPKSLALGLYVLNFSLTLVTYSPVLATVKDSDSVHISVLGDFLKAVLLGDARETVKFSDPLVLNGSTSADPDSDDPLEGLQFSWYCTTNANNYNGDHINVISKEVCLPQQVDLKLTWASASDPVLTISPETLRGGRVYFFRMVVTKTPRTAYTEKTVHVLPAPAPTASISCVENCGRNLVVSDRFSLFLNCPNCVGSRDAYKWSVQRASGEEIPFDWPGQTSTGRDSDSLSIKAFAFSNFSESQFWLVLNLETWGGVNLTLRHPFIVNYAPQIGDCQIIPTSGVSFSTRFVVQCKNFQDQNTPLTYKMIVSDLYDGFGEISSLPDNTLGTILYVGNDFQSPPSFLPVGLESSQFATKLFVQVYDTLGAFSQVTLFATVQAPTVQASPQAILNQLVNFSRGPNSEISTLLQKQEFLPAGYLMYMVASVLSSMKPEPALHEDKTMLWEHLVNQSFLLAMDTLNGINQVVTALAKVTQRTSEFPQVARKPATDRIWQANQAFRQHQQRGQDLHSEQIETMSTGILTVVSNILKMADRHVIYVDPFRVIQSLAETVLAGKVPDDGTTVMSSPSFIVYVGKVEKWAVSNQVLGSKRDCRNCFQPTLNVNSTPLVLANAPVSMVFYEFADDPFPWLDYPESLSLDVVGFRLTGTMANGDETELTPDVVDVYVSRRNLSSAAFNLTVGPDQEPENPDESARQTTGAFRFQVDSREVRELLVHIVTEVTVQFTVLVYAGWEMTPSALVTTFLVPHDIPPIVNHSDLFDPACAVSVARLVCLPLSLLQVIAQRGQSPECVIIVALKAPHFVMQPSNKLVRVSLFGIHCLDMNGIQSDWREDVCVLGEKTTWDRVHCVCGKARRARRLATVPLRFRHLTAKMVVPPNPVDLRLEVIKEVTHNSVTLLVVVFILFLYSVLAFWALHRDETDQFLRDHAIVLPDNDPYDNTCYLVTVFTGSRCGSGTRANVFVQLTGTRSTSDVHCLSHPQFKTLYRGSVNTFLLTTSRNLGDIQSIRVWHNNEGRAPGWYLSRIKVENLFSRHIWLFMCREWLSIETSLDRTFPVTDPNAPLQRMDFLLIDGTYKLEKNHIWFSVFAGVIARGFNRLQRLSCCLAMLLSTLLCNIMFFNLDREDKSKSRESQYVRSMVIGLQSVMITLPVQFIISGLFFYSQRRPQATLNEVAPQEHPEVEKAAGHWEERLEKWYAQETTAEARSQQTPGQKAQQSQGLKGRQESLPQATPKAGLPPKKRESKGTPKPTLRTDTNANTENVDRSPEAPPAPPPPPPLSLSPLKSRTVLPPCCKWIAWFLVFATSGVSSYFIVFYGLTYGYHKSIEWVFASFCSFCQSIFLVQPLKIILLTSIRTNRLKYCKNLPWISSYRYTEVQLQELWLHPEEMGQRHLYVAYLRASRMYQPLTPDEVGIFRRKREIKRRALLFLGRFLAHCLLLALLLGLGTFLRQTDSFRYNQFIRSRFSAGLAAVTTLDDIYPWLDGVLLPLLHNDPRPTFLPDSSSKILGLPLMRQVRAAPGPRACRPAGRFPPGSIEGEIRCHPKHGADPEDTADHPGFWKKVDKRQADKNADGFTYRPREKRWVYHSYGLLHTYGSGGYAFYFFPDQQRFNSTLRLRDLRSSRWLDENTWAVILELTTLNPDAGLLCSAAVLFEVSQLGVVNASIPVHSFALADLNIGRSAEAYLYVAILVVFIVYVVYEGHVLTEKGLFYVASASHWSNLAHVSIFAVWIALSLRKYFLATAVIQFYASNPEDFIPFHAVAQADRYMEVALGLLLFLTILKTLRYLRFFYHVRLAQGVLQTALLGTCHAALLVCVYVLLFVALGHLVFGQHEWGYSSVVHATQTVFSYCTAALRDEEFSSNRALGILFLAAFVLLLICVLMNLFSAVILSAHRALRQPVYEEPSQEAEAIVYLYDKLRTGFGFLSTQPQDPGERQPLVDMLYGKPEKCSRHYRGLKTRNINERKMVYLVV
ncbi:polycystic kidney disease and receptor for egg jelly-related protein [Pipistrellus kuhlii]|uniref:Polycystin family receptor for egg jelly n=1 Tax=Pipistrellus kuhlii TaxID=59472 RepID=A0A7J7RNP5_PIPKU|nr:polycystic kidney disease and receptor for egg jelly-related protein [Pipistrellus kuhlii]KAF6277544.1 polycystin family receptor for egg jelly [Pipistrellus kuhlii]